MSTSLLKSSSLAQETMAATVEKPTMPWNGCTTTKSQMKLVPSTKPEDTTTVLVALNNSCATTVLLDQRDAGHKMTTSTSILKGSVMLLVNKQCCKSFTREDQSLVVSLQVRNLMTTRVESSMTLLHGHQMISTTISLLLDSEKRMELSSGLSETPGDQHGVNKVSSD